MHHVFVSSAFCSRPGAWPYPGGNTRDLFSGGACVCLAPSYPSAYPPAYWVHTYLPTDLLIYRVWGLASKGSRLEGWLICITYLIFVVFCFFNPKSTHDYCVAFYDTEECSLNEEYADLPTHLTYLPTYLPNYLPTYQITYVPAYLPTYLPGNPPTYLPTSLPTYLPTHQVNHLPTFKSLA